MAFFFGRFPTQDYMIFDHMRDYFRTYAEANNVLLRVTNLNGEGDVTPANISPLSQAALNREGVTRDDWNEHGITVGMFGSFTTTDPDWSEGQDTHIPMGSGLFPDDYDTDQYTRRLILDGGSAFDTWSLHLSSGDDMVMGEIDPENRLLVFHHDLRYWSRRPSRVQFARVFNEALELATAPVDDAARRERSMAAFRAVAKQRTNAELQAIEQRIADNEATLVMAHDKINKALTELKSDQELVTAVYARREQFDEGRFNAEWEALERHANIVSVRFNGQTLIVNTDEIQMTVPEYHDSAIGESGGGYTVPVGEYTITIDFNTNSLKCRNNTLRKGNRDHPHVRDQGFCLGDLDNTMAGLIRERQIAAAAGLAIEALKTVTPADSWGRAERLWVDPDANPEDYA